MNKLILFCSLLIVLVVGGGCVDDETTALDSFLDSDKNELFEEENNLTVFHDNQLFKKYGGELSTGFLNWFNNEINTDYSHIRCIFNDSCNGNFTFNIETIYSENPFSINVSLSRYGIVGSFGCYQKYEICVFSFISSNIYFVNDILDLDYVNKVSFFTLSSDYEYNSVSMEELYYCKNDDDCIIVNEGCCSCRESGMQIAINKDYRHYWDEKLGLECVSVDASCAHAVSVHISCFSDSKCVNNKCKLSEVKQEFCSSSLYKNCKSGSSLENVDKIMPMYGVSCRKVIDLCRGYIITNTSYRKPKLF